MSTDTGARVRGMALWLVLAPFLAGAACAQTSADSTQPPIEEDAPKSAINWLQDPSFLNLPVIEPPVAAAPVPGSIETTPLDAQTRGGVGLLSPQITGLPPDTFRNARPEQLSSLISGLRPSAVPALQDLAIVLMLAELSPPPMPEGGDEFLRLRVDRLIAFGALDQAQALLEQTVIDTTPLFRQWFDISLLTGNDDDACAALRRAPALSSDMGARIFCLSRGGDWAAAALTLETGLALGDITPDDGALLARFLDPELFEGERPPERPDRMTPLRFRLLDGLGEPPETRALPLAFAISDLRDTIGWKAQIEAAERLARAQAIAPEQLRALYTARQPAASGGVWDRAAAFQAFETAFATGDPGAIANALPQVWAEMSRAALQLPFAELVGAELTQLPLAPAASQLAYKIGLLSKEYAEVAAMETPLQLPRDLFAASVALGTPSDPGSLGPVAQAIATGFTMDEPPPPFARLVAQNRLGEALLLALTRLQAGRQSDPEDISSALALFRTQGLEDTARRTALQLLLMERAQ